MTLPDYLFDIDDHPPLLYALLYGLQWAFIMFPAVVIAVTLCGNSLSLDASGEVRFLQFVLIASGFFTALQSLWGHRYPLLEGPATALLLTFTLLAPSGIQVIQGGLIFGGTLLIFLVLSGRLNLVIRFFTPNVVGVILILIALGLLPLLMNFMVGKENTHSQGDLLTLSISLGLVFLMATLSYRLKGFLQSISLLIGMLVGSCIFFILGLLDWRSLTMASWLSFPSHWIPSLPHFHWSAWIAFASAYLAVIVNSLGSIQGIANITDRDRLPSSIQRGILVNGAAGICCGLLGIVGTVSYSVSPGVVLANRVASRYVITYCGVILLAAAFIPKLVALLAMIPTPVVGATLCVAMGGQIGAGINIIATQQLKTRDYFIVGLPLLLGTMVGFLPQSIVGSIPATLRVFLANGLIVGIFVVLLLEHVLLRNRKSFKENGS
jgi:uracil permease